MPEPGQQPPRLPPSAWRCVVISPHGHFGVEQVIKAARPTAMTSRADKQLLAVLGRDDVDALRALCIEKADHQALCQLLTGLRLAASDPGTAVPLLVAALDSGRDPVGHRFVSRFLPGLHLPVLLAPGVPVLLPADHRSVALLLVELLTAQGRQADALARLKTLPVDVPVVLSLAGVQLGLGHTEAVVALTTGIQNYDDLTSLCLVARGVALRMLGRTDEAVVALDQVISGPVRRHAGVVVAALEERANLLRLNGDELAAQADMERIRDLGAMPMVVEVNVDEADTATEEDPDVQLRRARAKVRRRIVGMGEPGTFGGRHHRSYRAEVEAMLTTGQLDACENLLLCLLDAVEDEADERATSIDPTFYLTLADLYESLDRPVDQRATLERFVAAKAHWGAAVDEGVDLESYLRILPGHVAPPAAGPGQVAAPAAGPDGDARTPPSTVEPDGSLADIGG